MKPVTVKELIKFLETLPENLPIAYKLHSEQCLMELGDLEVFEACLPRPDGWIQYKRPDKPSQLYLIFPGN